MHVALMLHAIIRPHLCKVLWITAEASSNYMLLLCTPRALLRPLTLQSVTCVHCLSSTCASLAAT